MAKITAEQFLNAIQQNKNRVKKYRLGGDGSDGECDCIGLIIGALKLAGLKWPWTHGSNYAARNQIADIHKISSTKECFAGEIVFKARAPGDPKYTLPDKYKSSGDLLDYYHVGAVTSISPFQITHCTSVDGGIKVDTSLGQWGYGGELKLVNYQGGEPMELIYQAKIMSGNRQPVRMRKAPNTNASVIEMIPIDVVVDVLQEVDNDWAKISDNGIEGYMMRKFLIKVDSQSDESDDIHEAVDKVYALLREALDIIENIGLG